MAGPDRRVNSRSLRRELRHIYEDGNAVRSPEYDPENLQKKGNAGKTASGSGKKSGKASFRRGKTGRAAKGEEGRRERPAGKAKKPAGNVSRSSRKTFQKKNRSEAERKSAGVRTRTSGSHGQGSTVKMKSERKEKSRRTRSVLEERRLRNNRANARAVRAGTVWFITIACVISMLACVSYLRLRSRRVTQLSEIASKQSQLSTLQSDNDAYYKEVTASESLSEIRKTALEKLGMKYPDESQIRYYNTDENSYVRQYTDVPDDE